MNSVHDRVQAIFRDVFDDPSITIHDETTARDVPGWDSLTHINLIIALERGLRLKFATAEIARMKEHGQNVGKLIQLIKSKLGEA